MSSFEENFGPWALMTGASAGLGEEFARQVAAEGLNYELKKHGVPVVALTPGFTRSEYTGKLDLSRVPMRLAKTGPVVRKALRSLGDERLAIPGLMNRMMGWTMPLMGRRMNTSMMGMMMKRLAVEL